MKRRTIRIALKLEESRKGGCRQGYQRKQGQQAFVMFRGGSPCKEKSFFPSYFQLLSSTSNTFHIHAPSGVTTGNCTELTTGYQVQRSEHLPITIPPRIFTRNPISSQRWMFNMPKTWRRSTVLNPPLKPSVGHFKICWAYIYDPQLWHRIHHHGFPYTMV